MSLVQKISTNVAPHETGKTERTNKFIQPLKQTTEQSETHTEKDKQARRSVSQSGGANI